MDNGYFSYEMLNVSFFDQSMLVVRHQQFALIYNYSYATARAKFYLTSQLFLG